MKRKNTRQNIKAFMEAVTVITVILSIIVGSIAIIQSTPKVVKTFAEMAVIHDNIVFAQEHNDHEDDAYWQNIREEKYYNSDDTLVRTFSRSNIVVKLVWTLGSILAIPAIIIMYAYVIYNIIMMIIKSNRKAKNRQTKRNRRG